MINCTVDAVVMWNQNGLNGAITIEVTLLFFLWFTYKTNSDGRSTQILDLEVKEETNHCKKYSDTNLSAFSSRVSLYHSPKHASHLL